LYSHEELSEWIDAGVVDVRPAFSKYPDLSEGCAHVQDRTWKDREDIKSVFRNGARFYICGMAGMSKALRETCVKIVSEEVGCGLEEAAERFEKISSERFSTDVFG